MDITAPILTLPDAANAAGLDPRYLRELLNEGRLLLFGQPMRRPGQHHRASVLDALRLLILRRLRDAGLSDAQAIYVLDLAIDPRIGGLCSVGIPIPLGILAGRLRGGVVHVIPDEGDDMPDVYSRPSGFPAPDDAAVAITVNLGTILTDVLDRLPPTAAGAAIAKDIP